MRAAVIAVVVMGVLIFVGVAVLVGVLVRGVGGPAANIDAALPAGSRVEQISADSGRLYVLVTRADGTRAVLIVNGANGRLLGQLAPE